MRYDIYNSRNNSPIRLAFRELRKANLSVDFPVIDDINKEAKTVTRMEVLNLMSKEYQNIIYLDKTVRKYIDELSMFCIVDWKGIHYEQGADFQEKYLEIGIPAGKYSVQQRGKLVELQEYAQTKDVTLVINEVP